MVFLKRKEVVVWKQSSLKSNKKLQKVVQFSLVLNSLFDRFDVVLFLRDALLINANNFDELQVHSICFCSRETFF